MLGNRPPIASAHISPIRMKSATSCLSRKDGLTSRCASLATHAAAPAGKCSCEQPSLFPGLPANQSKTLCFQTNVCATPKSAKNKSNCCPQAPTFPLPRRGPAWRSLRKPLVPSITPTAAGLPSVQAESAAGCVAPMDLAISLADPQPVGQWRRYAMHCLGQSQKYLTFLAYSPCGACACSS